MNAVIPPIDFLRQRNSHPKLVQPAPQGEALERIFQAALRAPDHAALTPWRMLACEGKGLDQLGDIFRRAEARRDPQASEEQLNRIQGLPQRAPLVVLVIASTQAHPKVPVSEQLLSAGCVAHGLLLAAEAEGFAGMWRSGWLCFDPGVHAELGMSEGEHLVGFLYLGTPYGRRKNLPELKTKEFVTWWQ